MKNIFNIISILFIIISCNLSHAQSDKIIAVTGSGELVEIDPITCQYNFLQSCSSDIFSIAFYNNKIYYVDYFNNLYQVDYNTNNCVFLGQFLVSDGQYNAMTVNENGLIFVVEYMSNQVETFDINTGLFNLLGNLPSTIESGGDLMFINNTLILSTLNNTLVEIDINNLSNITLLLTHNLKDVFGIGSFSRPCENNTYFFTSLNGSFSETNIIEFNPFSLTVGNTICTLPFAIFDTASTTENGISTATPLFTEVLPICIGETLNPLPTISINGYSGIWTPAINNQETTTYTFTPDEGQCAISTQLTIEINPQIEPIFAPVPPICLGDLFTLPATSNNNISGTWSPAVNNQATTTYTFTPNLGQCATTTQLTVVVNQNNIEPNFTPIPTICSGDLIILPNTSNNNISGTWSPAFNNQATTTYTFTPNLGQCAITTQLTVVVIPKPNIVLENQLICYNPTTEIYNPVIINSGLSNNNYSFEWFFTPINGTIQSINQSTSSITVSLPGTYGLKITDLITNCESDLSTCEIIVNEIPFSIDVETINHFTNQAQINVIVNGNSLPLMYQINDNFPQFSPTFNNLEGGLYVVKVFDIMGCFFFEKPVFILSYMKFFTPNADGFNDFWNFKDPFRYIKEVNIFDRYGKLIRILKNNEILSGWNGQYNGTELPSTDYWFTVHYLIGEKNYIFKNHFSMKR